MERRPIVREPMQWQLILLIRTLLSSPISIWQRGLCVREQMQWQLCAPYKPLTSTCNQHLFLDNKHKKYEYETQTIVLSPTWWFLNSSPPMPIMSLESTCGMMNLISIPFESIIWFRCWIFIKNLDLCKGLWNIDAFRFERGY